VSDGIAGRETGNHGFSLVELLTVIGIIALLIAILLPALKKARDAANFVVCQSNIHQVALSLRLYAQDNKDMLPGTLTQSAYSENLTWDGYGNALFQQNPTQYSHPMQTSVMYKYISNLRVLKCPASALNWWYDYTMMDSLAGAKTELTWKVSYPLHPEITPASAFNPPTYSMQSRVFFSGIPLLIEEHDLYNQTDYPDGYFATWDQFNVTRHRGKCSVAMLDGSVIAFTAPHGPLDAVIEPQDLCCYHLLLHANNAAYDMWGGGATSNWGWANQPWWDPTNQVANPPVVLRP
jgi:prepilin-type N-terminal cleavage/methylation domain-containing protein/prepilin-type processing-associated H-X9-DG protein